MVGLGLNDQGFISLSSFFIDKLLYCKCFLLKYAFLIDSEWVGGCIRLKKVNLAHALAVAGAEIEHDVYTSLL